MVSKKALIVLIILSSTKTKSLEEVSPRNDNSFSNLKAELQSTLSDLKNKLKNNLQIKPKVELSPVGPRPGSYLDFPGRNVTRIGLIKDEWNEYYDCLKLQEQVLGSDKIFNPESRLVIAGTNVKVDCNICVSPLDSATKVKWFYWPTLTTNLSEIIELSLEDDLLISFFDNTLHILNVQPKRGGMYLCKHSDSFIAPIYIEVVFKEPMEIVTMKNITSYKSKSLTNQILTVTTNWQKWTPCSACDRVGKKLRLGFCYVYRQNDELFRLFEDGVPCRSQLLSNELKQEHFVSNASSKLMISLCKEKCANNQIFKVKDEFGNVLETANNSAGYYSFLQGVPQVPSSLKSQTLTADEFTSVIVICPGFSYDDEDQLSPIEWQTNNKLLVPRQLSDQSSGRIEIDHLGRMTFNQLWSEDAKIYSCWKNKQLIGLLKLQVIRNEKHSPQLGLTNHLFTLMAMCLAMTFVYVAVRVLHTKKPD